MPNSPHKYHHNRAITRNNTPHSPKHHIQHGSLDQDGSQTKSSQGRKRSLLLALPTESLTHITSSLDPQSLFVLARVNTVLHQHIEHDNTWRRAFVYQFLGVSPEADINVKQGLDNGSQPTLMLRREEGSWKKEFVMRWNLRRRWERSRPSPISHVPVHSSISSMYLMPSPTFSAPVSPAIITSSLQYGIVARSYPLTGKILRGYLDASGTMNGLGVGNPNAEFTPDLTQCVLTAEGGTARVLWGFRTGAVAVTTAPKAMESGRAIAARWVRSSLADSHEGPVQTLAWANGKSGNNFFVTGSADGRVKVWEAKRASCLWTSELALNQLVGDPCAKVVVDSVNGIISAIMKSGRIFVWAGFSRLFLEDVTVEQLAIKTYSITPRVHNQSQSSPLGVTNSQPLSFNMDCSSPNVASLLTAFVDDSYFTRTSINLDTGDVNHVIFADECGTSFSTLFPVFSMKPEEFSFIVAGDKLGCVSIFNWDKSSASVSLRPSDNASTGNTGSVLPCARFEAHSDGAVTALSWTPTTLLTGSSGGSIRAFDSLTLEHLRTFMTSTSLSQSSEIKQIIAAQDFFVASAGNRVVAWRGEPVGKQASHNTRGKRTQRATSGVAKWQQQVEIHNEIVESRQEMEFENTRTRRTFGREREHQSTLQNLGLNEVEAVQYVLMLSRDEEERRSQQETLRTVEGDMISGEFDEDIQTPINTRDGFIETSSTAGLQYGSASNRRIPPQNPSNLLDFTRIQTTPPRRAEPMEAGSPIPGSVSSSLVSRSSSGREQPPSSDDPGHFPSISSTPTHRSVSGSPQSYRSAWSSPLKVNHSRSSDGPSSPRGSATSAASSPIMRVPSMPPLSASFTHLNLESRADEDEDEDLRFVMELSLAEARSRGEDV